MLATTKIKWLTSIILAGILLGLALMGGKWGTSYAATSDGPSPIIYSVLPPKVPVRSLDKVIVVAGLYYGGNTNTGVRLQGNNFDKVLHTIAVQDNAISVLVTDTLMTEATVYTLTVVRSDADTVPVIPLVPPYDHESNPLDFTVFQAEEYFLPIIRR
jgi:hypothetical protein